MPTLQVVFWGVSRVRFFILCLQLVLRIRLFGFCMYVRTACVPSIYCIWSIYCIHHSSCSVVLALFFFGCVLAVSLSLQPCSVAAFAGALGAARFLPLALVLSVVDAHDLFAEICHRFARHRVDVDVVVHLLRERLRIQAVCAHLIHDPGGQCAPPGLWQ